MDIILDSGAFSAWTRGVAIDRAAYADYILSHSDTYRYFVNLDCIPSTPGDKNITADKVELSAQIGWDNLEYLLSRGVPKDRLLPVFHQGENFAWLEKMRDADFPYIGISPGNDRASTERIEWLRECMYYATDSAGLPYMKWHGFAATGFDVMRAIPWYSADSISYALNAGMGTIYIPKSEMGQYCYEGSPFMVSVTARKVGHSDTGDILTLSAMELEYVKTYLSAIGVPWGASTYRDEPLGYKAVRAKNEVAHIKDTHVSVETKVVRGVTNDWMARVLVNALYYAHHENTQPNWPYPYTTRTMHFGLSRKAARSVRTSTVQGIGEPIRIYYASAIHRLNYMRAHVMRRTGRDQYRQLVSYHYLRNCALVEKQYKEWNDGLFDSQSS